MKKEMLRISDLCADRKNGCCLHHIYFHLYEGEVLGIVGLHDAGKTFLFDCIMGRAKVKGGRLFFAEQKVPWDYAIRNTEIYRIGRKSSLVESCTVLENLLILRKRRNYFGVLSWRRLRMQAEACLREFSIQIHPETLVRELSLEQRNEIELLKAYLQGSRLVLMDDILYMYGPGDHNRLYGLISKMQKKGLSFLMAGCQMEKISIFTERCLFMVDGWSVKTVENIRRNKRKEMQLLFGTKVSDEKENTQLMNKMEEHRRIHPRDAAESLCEIVYGEGKHLRVRTGEILVFLDVNHKEEEAVKALLTEKRRRRAGEIRVEGHSWKKSGELCMTDFLHTQPLIGSLGLCDNLCLAMFSRISRLGFISRKKTAVVEKFFLEQYPNRGWESVNGAYIPFAKEVAVFLERLKLQKWKLFFCFNLENIMTYELAGMIKEQLLKMTEGKRSVCIFASSLEKFKDFPDYYLIAQEDGQIGKYTYQELREYIGL